MNKFKKRLYEYLSKTDFLGFGYYFFNKLNPRKITKAIIDIGSTCNAKCPYCPRQQEGFTFKDNGLMTEEIFETIYSQLKEMPDLKNISLYAFGEPLLNKNAGEYIKKIAQLNKKTLLSTNTTNMDKFTDELMLIDRLQFSIEGWDKESYERTRKNLKFEETIEKLKNFDEEVKKRRAENLKTPFRTIHCLFTKSTDLHKFIETWSPYVDEIRFTTMGPYISWSDDKKSTKLYYTKEMEQDCFKFDIPVEVKTCSYVNNTITVNSNGKVVLCCGDFSQHLALGDYRDLNKAFNCKLLKNLVKQIYFGEKNICNGCRNYFACDKDKVYKYFPELNNLESLSTDKCKIIVTL
ncbi:radical SAM protein [bacterium]|nr:radical SAM protein [bacterium]